MYTAASRWRWATLVVLAALTAGATVGCDDDDAEDCFEQRGSLAQVTADTVTTDHVDAVFSPDGTRLLFSTDFWSSEDFDDKPQRDFALIDVPLPTDEPRQPLARLFDAHGARRLRLPSALPLDNGNLGSTATPHNVGEADWNPVTTDEVALVVQNDNGLERIYRMRILFGTETTQSIDLEFIETIDDVDLGAALAANRNQYYYRTPAYSPDGEWLAYSRYFYKDNSAVGGIDEFELPAIFAINLNDGRIVQVTQSSSLEQDPTWSPDGSSIAFTSNRAGAVGTSEVFRVPFDPDNPVVPGESDGATRLTRTNVDEEPKIFGGSFDPAWLSNGQIIFVSTRRAPCTSLRDRNLWIMDGSGGDPSMLFFSREDDHFPAVWRGGSGVVAFSSRINPVIDFEGQKTDLWLLRGF